MIAPARTFMRFSDTLGGRLSPMHISRLSVSVVISVLLSGNAIAGALEEREFSAYSGTFRPNRGRGVWQLTGVNLPISARRAARRAVRSVARNRRWSQF